MIKYFIEHPTAANLLMISFLIMGIFTVQKIKREAMPDFSTRTLQISANYAGATAEEVEEALAAPIEEALSEVGNIKSINTTAMEGAVSINVEMSDGTTYQEFYNDVKTQIDAISSFPNEMEKLIIKPFNHLDQVVSIAIYGDMPVTDLKAYCESFKDRLIASCSGVQVSLSGFSQREFRIELDPSILHAYKLSVKGIASIISSQNLDLPAGTIETGAQDIKLRFSDRKKSVADLAAIRILSSSSGSEVLLGDIAKITDRFSADENKILFNGVRAGVLTVSKSKSADSLTIYSKVMKLLEEEKKDYAPLVKFFITRDMASDIQDRLDMVYVNALQGFLLVFLSLWLFLNLKLSFWVSMGLPVSFLGGIFFMQLFGISLNMISTFALLIASGLLMDDAIVLSENIAVHLQRGEKSVDAAYKGVIEVGGGVISSFLTTICIFAPLVFLSGEIGKILCVVPFTLIIVLSVSIVEAFLILPHHMAQSFTNGFPEPSGSRKWIDFWIDRIRFEYIPALLSRIMPHRGLFIASILSVFIISLAMIPAGYLKFMVFPKMDGDTVVCKVMLPPGSPLSESEAVAAKISAAAERMNKKLSPLQPDGKNLVNFVSVNFSTNSDYKDSGAHLFTVYADLLSGDFRRSSMADVINVWREETGALAGVSSIKFEDMMSGPGGRAIEIRLHGEDLVSLKAASKALSEKLESYSGVFDVTDNLSSGKPELVMSLLPGALKLGFTADSIARQMRAAYQGEKADELQIGSDNYEFDVRMIADSSENLHNFDNFLLTAADGTQVPLLNIVEIRYERGASSISRYNGRRTVTVSADIRQDKANSQEITSDLQKSFLPALAKNYKGVSYSFGGQREAGSETGSSIIMSFVIGIFGIFILLSLQFRKILEPLVVMCNIPLAVTGVIWGHLLVGRSLDMQGLIGVIALAGVVVNDSIIMVEFIKKHEMNMDVAEAAVKASSDRFRAVVLTSLTTIAGLLPILLEHSLQAQMLIPLALSIVCGLATSTVLVLFVIPSAYVLVSDFRRSFGLVA